MGHALSGSVPPIELEHATLLAQGLKRSAREEFDVLLLDLTLPDSRGIDTVVQARRVVPDVPIVVLTGLDEEAFGVQVLKAGAQDYLSKDHLEHRAAARAIRYASVRRRAE